MDAVAVCVGFRAGAVNSSTAIAEAALINSTNVMMRHGDPVRRGDAAPDDFGRERVERLMDDDSWGRRFTGRLWIFGLPLWPHGLLQHIAANCNP